MSLELSADSVRKLDESIQRLADAAGETVKSVLPAQMRLFAKDLAFNTEPVGDSAGAQKKKGEDAVESKIRSIYITIGEAVNLLKDSNPKLVFPFERALKKKNFPQCAALLMQISGRKNSYSVGPFDGGLLHKSQRFKKRVRNQLVVTNENAIKQYITKTKKSVGFAKGGFASAARDLGGVRDIPQFATRHKGAQGSGAVDGDGKTLSVVMTNGVKYIRQALDSSKENKALEFRKKSIDLVLERMATRKFSSAMK